MLAARSAVEPLSLLLPRGIVFPLGTRIARKQLINFLSQALQRSWHSIQNYSLRLQLHTVAFYTLPRSRPSQHVWWRIRSQHGIRQSKLNVVTGTFFSLQEIGYTTL